MLTDFHETVETGLDPRPRGIIVGCPKGEKSPRYQRKMTRDHAKKTSEAGKSLSSFARGKLQKKNGRILSENGRPEMIAVNGRFPAETGGLESLTLLA